MSMAPRDEQEMADLIAFRVETEMHEAAMNVKHYSWATKNDNEK
jgi:hypothetical protein